MTIEWRESDDHVLMTGPVEFEREIELDPALFERPHERGLSCGLIARGVLRIVTLCYECNSASADGAGE